MATPDLQPSCLQASPEHRRWRSQTTPLGMPMSSPSAAPGPPSPFSWLPPLVLPPAPGFATAHGGPHQSPCPCPAGESWSPSVTPCSFATASSSPAADWACASRDLGGALREGQLGRCELGEGVLREEEDPMEGVEGLATPLPVSFGGFGSLPDAPACDCSTASGSNTPTSGCNCSASRLLPSGGEESLCKAGTVHSMPSLEPLSPTDSYLSSRSSSRSGDTEGSCTPTNACSSEEARSSSIAKERSPFVIDAMNGIPHWSASPGSGPDGRQAPESTGAAGPDLSLLPWQMGSWLFWWQQQQAAQEQGGHEQPAPGEEQQHHQ